MFASLALGSSPIPAWTQQTGKVWRIGFLGTVPMTTPEVVGNWQVFRQALQDRGYVEGKNVVFERRFSQGKSERFPALAAELVRLEVDVVVVAANAAAHVVKQATATTSIVFLLVANPVGSGLVNSLSHPGGNMTGVADYQLDLVPKRYELLRAAIPAASRVVIFTCEKCTALGLAHVDAATIAAARNARDALARSLGMNVTYVDLSSPQDFGAATTAALRARPDAIFLRPGPVNFLLRKELADFALRERIPMLVPLREQTVVGGLMSYGPSQADQYRKAAEYVDRILRGARPADLPVEQPTRLELVINMTTANALGITIPKAVLLRADEVIQ